MPAPSSAAAACLPTLPDHSVACSGLSAACVAVDATARADPTPGTSACAPLAAGQHCGLSAGGAAALVAGVCSAQGRCVAPRAGSSASCSGYGGTIAGRGGRGSSSGSSSGGGGMAAATTKVMSPHTPRSGGLRLGGASNKTAAAAGTGGRAPVAAAAAAAVNGYDASSRTSAAPENVTHDLEALPFGRLRITVAPVAAAAAGAGGLSGNSASLDGWAPGAGRAVPPSFLGISHEWAGFQEYTKTPESLRCSVQQDVGVARFLA
jgi:hypothetical protein